MLEHTDSKKNVLKLEKFPNVDETLKLVESLKEAKVPQMEEAPLCRSTDGAEVEVGCGTDPWYSYPTWPSSPSPHSWSQPCRPAGNCSWKVHTLPLDPNTHPTFPDPP